MSFGSQLKSARKAANLTQRQLADAIGAKHNSVSDWENDKNRPGPDTIAEICGVLHISPNYLLAGVAQIPLGFEPLPQMSRVPLVGNIACGTPIIAEQNIEGYVSVPDEWHASFTLKCKGDSMEPRIKDGDLVAIRQQPEVENGEIAAVRIGDEATLKRVYRSADRLLLQPENPNYAPVILIGEEINTAHIEGKAIGLCRAL